MRCAGRLSLCLATIFVGVLAFAPALAQEPTVPREWPVAPEYDVLLTSFAIQPQLIKLKAGEPVRLRFVNNSNQRHRFSAPAFFRAAEIREHDRFLVRGGAVTLPPLSTLTVGLVPKAGSYHVEGDNLVHRLIGMTAHIAVEQERP